MPADAAGRPALRPLLAEFGRRRWTNLLVEGGAAVIGSFFDARVIDEAHVFLAPKWLGGVRAPSPVGGEGVDTVPTAPTFEGWQVEQVEGDVYWRGWVGQTD